LAVKQSVFNTAFHEIASVAGDDGDEYIGTSRAYRNDGRSFCETCEAGRPLSASSFL